MEDKILETMKGMAWERAKGELNSMLHTFWNGDMANFDSLSEKIKKFIEDIEDHEI